MLRPHLLVLNKVDLTDMTRRDRVEELLQLQGVNSVVYTNCKEQTNMVVKKKVRQKRAVHEEGGGRGGGVCVLSHYLAEICPGLSADEKRSEIAL